jgi:hypothetical protein
LRCFFLLNALRLLCRAFVDAVNLAGYFISSVVLLSVSARRSFLVFLSRALRYGGAVLDRGVLDLRQLYAMSLARRKPRNSSRAPCWDLASSLLMQLNWCCIFLYLHKYNP